MTRFQYLKDVPAWAWTTHSLIYFCFLFISYLIAFKHHTMSPNASPVNSAFSIFTVCLLGAMAFAWLFSENKDSTQRGTPVSRFTLTDNFSVFCSIILCGASSYPILFFGLNGITIIPVMIITLSAAYLYLKALDDGPSYGWDGLG